MKQKHCSWCDNIFETSISYQIYCCPTCREHATKEKITARYQILRRKNRRSQDRRCKSCGSNLSMYNDDSLCQACEINPSEVARAIKEIKGIANGKNWTK